MFVLYYLSVVLSVGHVIFFLVGECLCLSCIICLSFCQLVMSCFSWLGNVCVCLVLFVCRFVSWSCHFFPGYVCVCLSVVLSVGHVIFFLVVGMSVFVLYYLSVVLSVGHVMFFLVGECLCLSCIICLSFCQLVIICLSFCQLVMSFFSWLGNVCVCLVLFVCRFVSWSCHFFPGWGMSVFVLHYLSVVLSVGHVMFFLVGECLCLSCIICLSFCQLVMSCFSWLGNVCVCLVLFVCRFVSWSCHFFPG